MNDRDLSDLRGVRVAKTEVRLKGFYWVILGQNPPEIAYWERGEWWLAGDAKPWQPEAVTVVSDRLVFKAAPGTDRMTEGGHPMADSDLYDTDIVAWAEVQAGLWFDVHSDRVLSKPELRQAKPCRADFAARARNPVTVVLDGVSGNYNIGAIFRLCDAFLVERLIICGIPNITLRKRKLIQAAMGTQHWVPWQEEPDAAAVVRAARAAGHWIVAVELTGASVSLAAMQPHYPAVLVLGGEREGVSQGVLACADRVVALPMLGMANSLNVATAGAIVLHALVQPLLVGDAIAAAGIKGWPTAAAEAA